MARRSRKFSLVLATTAMTLGLSAAPAHAAPPANDTKTDAEEISALPFNDSVDTSQATTDADDTALNDQCGAPATNASVWYSYTAPAGVDGVVVDVSASSYSAGVIIAAPDGLGGHGVIACGPGGSGAAVLEGVTYLILAFSDSPGVTGGLLVLHAEASVMPEVSLVVNPRGKVDRYGNALISGTYTCSGGDFLDLFTSLRQLVGRFAVQGDGYAFGACDGATYSWSAVVVPYNGKFAGGRAATFTFAFSCGSVFCADAYVERTVRLSR